MTKEKFNLFIYKLKLRFSRKYRRNIALNKVKRRRDEWAKVAAQGKGYVNSHNLWVYEEMDAIIIDLYNIL